MENVRLIVDGQTPISIKWCNNPDTNDFLNTSLFYIGGGIVVGYVLSTLTAYKAFGTTMGCGMTLNYWDGKKQTPSRKVLFNTDGIHAAENEPLTETT
ncbi:uncharacterized protein LOC106670127 isoform X2 [Cimex lectularius]|uniref:Uncharacterized protein n=1 Tax=Cimex lectularius TaxID=79782 RepID=A0A8I6S4M0_CIMLE|nr:uncharacterized protein LOC106670127 isoform X2 [Cimex lectularius]